MKTFSANINCLYEILLFVREEVERLGFIPYDIQKIEVAVEEILVNIISYGYADSNSENAIISIKCEPISDQNKGIAIHIYDNGIPYNPLASAQASRDPIKSFEEPIGGLGIYLVLKLMDNVHYRRESDKNILILKKYIIENPSSE